MGVYRTGASHGSMGRRSTHTAHRGRPAEPDLCCGPAGHRNRDAAIQLRVITPGRSGTLGSINLSMWACIAPAQAVVARFGAQLARRIAADSLSRVFAGALAGVGVVMLSSSFGWP